MMAIKGVRFLRFHLVISERKTDISRSGNVSDAIKKLNTLNLKNYEPCLHKTPCHLSRKLGDHRRKYITTNWNFHTWWWNPWRKQILLHIYKQQNFKDASHYTFIFVNNKHMSCFKGKLLYMQSCPTNPLCRILERRED